MSAISSDHQISKTYAMLVKYTSLKSNPWIVMVSTPNMPGGLFEQIERERRRCMSLSSNIPRLLIWNIREYNLKYLGSIGNLLRFADIDTCIEEYELPTNAAARFYYPTWVGCDPGFSSSMFRILVVQWSNDKLEVVYAKQLDKPLYTDALNLVRSIIQRYGACKVFIDGSAAHICHELKHGYQEFVQYETLENQVLKSFISS
jgi:hypothetical protein